MKFKSVEISAFRIYDNPADAKFDFTIGDNSVANFVSLYAPNGFGKTSFYDAVEWGVTNNINRFWQNQNTEMSLVALKEEQKDQIKLWRNRNALKKTKTFVKIIDEADKAISRELKPHGNSSSDISGRNTIENKNFRQVILSQEWISSFLKEMNGIRRYEIFMENPQLQAVESYYKSTKELLSVCSDKISACLKQIEIEKSKLVELEVGDVLGLVNSQIELINKTYQQSLNKIVLTTTKEEVFKFQVIISETRLKLEQISDLTTLVENTELAIGGRKDELISLELYFERLARIIQVQAELLLLDAAIKQFELLNSLNNQVATDRKKQNTLNQSKTEIAKIQQDVQGYIDSLTAINSKTEQKNKKVKESKQDTAEKENTERTIVQQKEEFDSVIKQLESSKQKLLQIPVTTEQVTIINTELLRLQASQQADQITEQSLLRQLSASDRNLIGLDEVIKSINNGTYTLPGEDDTIRFKGLIDTLVNNQQRIQALSVQISTLSENIDAQEALNSTVQDFIAEGIKIIDATKATACPLCEQDYKTYETLADKITNNKALSQILQSQYQLRTSLNDEARSLTEQVANGKKELKDFIEAKITVERQGKTNVELELQKLRRSQSGITEEITKLTERKSNLHLSFEGLDQNGYTAKLTGLIETLEKSRTALDSKLKQVQKVAEELIIKINSTNANISLLDSEIKVLKQNPAYTSVIKWYQSKFPGEPVDVTRIKTEADRFDKDIFEIVQKISQLEKGIEEQRQLLSTSNHDELKVKRKETGLLLEQHNADTSSYEAFLTRLGIKNKPDSSEFLKAELTRIKENTLAALTQRRQLVLEYNKLEELCKNLGPFLQSELAKKQINGIQEELAFLDLKAKPYLELEKRNVRDFLEKRVKSFFYTDLINSIYNRIDPHPDFKSVLFKPDFDSDTPRLDVFVINGVNEESLIPNLYFSTAQINILSLSIFLATALNNSEYDCIFIDDPIQSMDSINILSTIDLLRSIVEKGDKQIILSTHDENFHKLLMKKMPPEYFKSKFLSLETFGKVRSEVSQIT